jgi:hypothetical protein
MMDDPQGLATAASVALFALTFLLGQHIHPMRNLVHDRRSVVSFGAGVSTAYLFMRMMPELSEAQATVAKAGILGTDDGVVVYLAALTGFLLVYGLDHFHMATGQTISGLQNGAGIETQEASRPYGIAAYVLLLTYVLVKEPVTSPIWTLQYALAIAFHFLAVDHSLRDEMGDAYGRPQRIFLATMCVLGWALAQAADLPEVALALLLAFVSGGVIVNSAIMELPSERDGRFFPFVLGSLLFGLVLMGL